MSPHGAEAAGVTIQRVFRDFLGDRREELSPADYRLYRHVIFFLELCINNYGHRNLDEGARARFESLYHEPGSGRHFFEVFGPENLLPELEFFTGTYLGEEIHTSARVVARAPDVIASLKEWLLGSGLVPPQALEREERRSRERARMRSRLRRLTLKVSRSLVSVQPEVLAEEDYVRLDEHLISRVEPGKIWLRVFRSGTPEKIGPLLVPLTASRTLRVGWCLCCALGRLGGRWQVIELHEIYPRTVEPPARPDARERPPRYRMGLPLGKENGA